MLFSDFFSKPYLHVDFHFYNLLTVFSVNPEISPILLNAAQLVGGKPGFSLSVITHALAKVY
ncbi:MAG: hypothetical protein EAZ73_23575 [Oscillatoriales cyanobacterium]|nr:MAG: hypothetical protein EAZ79_06585 [Oscillatoriales cyanobacterium]TAF16726.1 MAG: hypothetical protein EAZ73_23575 [Oscillatoriales cyanobacterium]TAF27076.1 MAG: hypothetical protein EAZ69_28405 [Oscillatoriales cyanobacterium]